MPTKSSEVVSAKGIPQEYDNAFEWASAWVEEHGVTLPPDTNELRSLRNWFCFKLNQFKKGKLGAQNEALLAHYGIDFNQYHALNTGTGQMAPDFELIQELKEHRRLSGSYDLNAQSSPALLEWHASLTKRYRDAGKTRRMLNILRSLPDLHMGTWNGPDDAPLTSIERQWWAMADRYELLAGKYPPRNGIQHPDMPAPMQEWAQHQQSLFATELLPKRARGWMKGVGLAMKKPSIERKSIQPAMLDEKLHQYGVADTRLETIRGMLALMELSMKNRDAKSIMSHFQINPVVLKTLQDDIRAHWKKEWSEPVIDATRLIALRHKQAFAPSWWRTLDDYPMDQLTCSNSHVRELGEMAYTLTKRYQELPDGKGSTHQQPAPDAQPIASDSSEPSASVPAATITLKHYALEFLEATKAQRGQRTHSTLQASISRWIIPVLGEHPVPDIDETRITEFLALMERQRSNRRRGFSESSLHNIRTALFQVLNHGRKQLNLAPLESKSVRAGLEYSSESEVDPFSKSEALLMLKLIREDYENVLEAVLYSGLYTAKLLRLRLSDVHPDQSTFTFSAKRGDQRYPIDWKMMASVQREIARPGPADRNLYTNKAYQEINPSNFGDRVLEEIQQYAGLRERGHKQFRNTAVLFWISEGRSLEWIFNLTNIPVKTLQEKYVPHLSTFLSKQINSRKPRMPMPTVRGSFARQYAAATAETETA